MIVFNNMPPNRGQEYIINQAIDFVSNSSEQVFQYTGGPGTGKSYVMYRIAKRLVDMGYIGWNDILACAYTGQASIVMRTKGFPNAKTLHSTIYKIDTKPMTNEVGQILMNTKFNIPMEEDVFRLDLSAARGKKLMFIDEAGMVPLSMKKAILSLGIKIIAGGDLFQLPPVGDDPAFLVDGKIHMLTEVMRQEQNSGIVYIANRARLGLPIHKGFYGNILVIGFDDITDEMISKSSIVICGTNKTREMINNKVRRDILKIKKDLPEYGERLICRKNNWRTNVEGISLANGLIGTCVSMPNMSTFNGDIFTMNFAPDLIDSQFSDLVCDYDYFRADHKEKERIKKSKYSLGEKFDLAYALTTHLSQGSEHANGMYISEHMFDDKLFNNLNNTGCTRFKKSEIYVLPRKRVYYNGY